MKRITTLLILCLTFFYTHSQNDVGLAFHVGIGTPFGGDGYVFEPNSPPPHEEFAATFGAKLAYFVTNRSWISLGAMYGRQNSHFHANYNGEEYTADYKYRFINIPLTFTQETISHLKGRVYTEYTLGLGVNVGNLLDEQRGRIPNSPLTYLTDVEQRWRVQPEFIVGIGWSFRTKELGKFHIDLMLHATPLKNHLYFAKISDGDAYDFTAGSTLFPRRAMVEFSYFPRFGSGSNAFRPCKAGH